MGAARDVIADTDGGMNAQPSLFGAQSQSHKRGWISRRTKERAPIIAKMIQMQREHANNSRKDD